jgi:hypothetical protein
MNTTFIIQDKEQFKKIQACFKELSRSKQATAADHVFYNIVRGKPIDRGFTPITNENKLRSNYVNRPMWAFEQAKSMVNFQSKPSKYHVSHLREVFGEFITEEQWAQIAEVSK